MLHASSSQHLSVRPYTVPTGNNLGEFFSAPCLHLCGANVLGFTRSTAAATPRIAQTAPELSRRFRRGPVLDRYGRRLPSIVKKPVPLPPTDIRSVPHAKTWRPIEPVKPVRGDHETPLTVEDMYSLMRNDYDDIEQMVKMELERIRGHWLYRWFLCLAGEYLYIIERIRMKFIHLIEIVNLVFPYCDLLSPDHQLLSLGK